MDSISGDIPGGLGIEHTTLRPHPVGNIPETQVSSKTPKRKVLTLAAFANRTSHLGGLHHVDMGQ